jgi:hypothetical protein
MKWFVLIAFASIISLMIATYHPFQVCQNVGVETQVHCDGPTCIATTSNPSLLCHWRN